MGPNIFLRFAKIYITVNISKYLVLYFTFFPYLLNQLNHEIITIMKKIRLSILITILCISFFSNSQEFEKDIFNTSKGELAITFIGHGTLMMEFNEQIIHIDPVGNYVDYSTMPKADLILITHEHGDHLDINAISKIKKENTTVILTQSCSGKYPEGKIMENGDYLSFSDVDIRAVPAYNMIHKRGDGSFFHPKGRGNGYIIDIGDTKVYVAGDTENIPEMKSLKDIDIAFLSMNLPYTMTPEMVADAAKAFQPKILYPYHFGSTHPNKLLELLNNEPTIEVRIRKLN